MVKILNCYLIPKKVMTLCLRVQFFLANPVYRKPYTRQPSRHKINRWYTTGAVKRNSKLDTITTNKALSSKTKNTPHNSRKQSGMLKMKFFVSLLRSDAITRIAKLKINFVFSVP